MALPEPELLDAVRAFPKSQELLAGAVVDRLANDVAVGWHDSQADATPGAIAVVRAGAGLDDLIGDVVRLTAGERSVLVYVIGARGVPQDISITRRAFLALGLLALESLSCVVETIG